MTHELYLGYDYNREHEFTNLMIISRDNLDFLSSLGFFKRSKRANILLAQPQYGQRWCPNCRMPLQLLVDQSGEWFWESLSAGAAPITKSQRAQLLSNNNQADNINFCC